MAYDIGKIQRIYLGVQGEYASRPLEFNVQPWLDEFPEGCISIYHLRNGQDESYPVATEMDREEGVLYWTPTIVDTQYKGRGLCQFRLTQDGVVRKTRNIPTEVDPALPGTMSEDVPPAIEPYVDTIEGFKNAAELAKEDAEAAQSAAEAAQEAAEDAQEAAEAAQEAAENAQAAAESYADDAEGSATQAASSATSAALFASQSSTSANAAQGFANSASLKATEASTSAAAADSAKTAAENAKEAAEDAAESIQSLTAAAETLDPDSQASASYDPETGTLTIGVPTGHQGDDGVSPAVTISTVTGGHTVKITDKDHPSGQSFTVLDGEDAFSITFTVTISATGITAASDKTWAQIVAAVVANQRLIAYVSANGLVAPSLEYQIINAPQQQGVVFYFDNSSEFVQGVYVNPAGRGMAITVTATGVTARYVSMEYIAAKVKMESGASVEEAISQVNQAKADKAALKEANRRIHLLEEAALGHLYTDESVTEESYQQTVPSGSLSNAVLGGYGGKSVVWNQVATSVNSSGSASQKYYYDATFTTEYKKGHKYFIKFYASSSKEPFYFSIGYGRNGAYTADGISVQDRTSGYQKIIFTPSDSSVDTNPNIAIRPIRYNVASDFDYEYNSFVIVDLTQLYGTGNEPSTTSDPRIAVIESYALAHPAYNGGEIVSANVNKYESIGVNLLNSTLESQTIVGVTITKNDDGSYTLNGTATAQRNIEFARINGTQEYPAGTYYYKCGAGSSSTWVHYLYIDDNGTISRPTYTSGTTVTVKEGKLIVFDIQIRKDAVFNNVVIKPMLNLGSSPIDYTPYVSHNYPIPAAVLSQFPLRSAGNVYDTITYEPTTVDGVTLPKWKHHKRVGTVDLGTFEYTMRTSSGRYIFGITCEDAKTVSSTSQIPNFLCVLYHAQSHGATWVDKDISFGGVGSHVVEIVNNDYRDPVSFADNMEGVILYYELATEVVTDITDLMVGWDGILEVEEGGTITFKQVGDTIFAIPNTINYLVKTTQGGA